MTIVSPFKKGLDTIISYRATEKTSDNVVWYAVTSVMDRLCPPDLEHILVKCRPFHTLRELHPCYSDSGLHTFADFIRC